MELFLAILVGIISFIFTKNIVILYFIILVSAILLLPFLIFLLHKVAMKTLGHFKK